MPLTLIIGNKNYSSWSFRPWIAMKTAGIPFDEVLISLEASDFKERVLKASGTGKVPVLIDGAVKVWEIARDPRISRGEIFRQRSYGRTIRPRARTRAPLPPRCTPASCRCATIVPMNMWRPVIKRELPDDVAGNVKRIDALWTDCRARFGAGGPFLFGAFGAADAMYAPVVSRFHTYGIEVGSRLEGLHGRGHGASGLGRMAGGGAPGALGSAP